MFDLIEWEVECMYEGCKRLVKVECWPGVRPPRKLCYLCKKRDQDPEPYNVINPQTKMRTGAI